MKTLNLFDLSISKTVDRTSSGITQTFEFVSKNIPCRILCWALYNKEGDYYAGFGQTWNHCSYVTLTKEQVMKLSPRFFEKGDFFDSIYAYGVFQHDEVTYTDVKDGQYTVGIDYQHVYNTADNTDLISVLIRLLKEVDEMTERLNS